MAWEYTELPIGWPEELGWMEDSSSSAFSGKPLKEVSAVRGLGLPREVDPAPRSLTGSP